MARRARIGKREIEKLGLGETIWDEFLPGFGARRQRSAAVSYAARPSTGPRKVGSDGTQSGDTVRA